ncbi:hypothetical protein OHB06_01190 [Streptomyces sp. NBC_01604]|uniref:hypothetical protein n=1 Tax=Streptomyces sp. NBC_01604 TaxID=2975894 RepID=UPI00386EA511
MFSRTLAITADGGGRRVWVQGAFGARHARRGDVGAQHLGAVLDVRDAAAGIADEGGDAGGQGGCAQIEPDQQLTRVGKRVTAAARRVPAEEKTRW